MADALERYRGKRDFSKTREPTGARQAAGERLFVVQKHAARRLHYDLRMQFGDTLRSWAVPQGPSLDPKIRRLAVRVEDHPLEYYDFEGPIPKGQYGAGAMIVWDRGTWVPMGDPEADYQKGTIKFRLSGEKLGGGWTLVRIKNPQERGDNWLLIKERDPYARPEVEGNILDEAPESVISGRRVEEILPDEPTAKSAAKPKVRLVRVAKLPGAKPGPLPASPRPQLASPSTSIPTGDDWLHEIKLDGYRTMARIEDGAVRFITRSGHDWTDRYGRLADAFTKIPCRQAVIDGEIVVQDEAGISRFSALQDALAEGRAHELTFFAFDLLHLDGYDLAEVPLLARKQALEALLEPVVASTSPLQLGSHIMGHGPDFLAQASRMGLEGVISKRADAHYRPGRTRTWLKTKCLQSDEFQIVGFAESPAAGGLGALLVAEPGEDGSLRYAGRVGTGWSAAEADRLQARLQALRQDQPAVEMPPADRRKAVWVRPVLQVEVHYGSRTADGILRHAVYKGLRADKPAPSAPSTARTPRQRWVTDEDLASVWVTNPDRRMFGAGGPTKLELALYYAQVGDWMLPELALRPVSLVRCPTGRAADCFFQRHAMSGMPEAIRQISLREEGSKERADYLYLENARGLLALSQFGAVELHSWGCRVDKPERPDRMVFDLDPDEGLPWRQVVDAAFEVRESLQDLGFVPFVKTTGGKGLHVVVALARRQAWPEVRRFAEAFAVHVARRLPKLFTANMAKSSRRGRIFLDYLRNGRSATAVAAFSLRARPGVPASTPVSWEELVEIDDPADLNYATVPVRLTEVDDPWAALAGSARSLTKEMERRLEAGR